MLTRAVIGVALSGRNISDLLDSLTQCGWMDSVFGNIERVASLGFCEIASVPAVYSCSTEEPVESRYCPYSNMSLLASNIPGLVPCNDHISHSYFAAILVCIQQFRSAKAAYHRSAELFNLKSQYVFALTLLSVNFDLELS